MGQLGMLRNAGMAEEDGPRFDDYAAPAKSAHDPGPRRSCSLQPQFKSPEWLVRAHRSGLKALTSSNPN